MAETATTATEPAAGDKPKRPKIEVPKFSNLKELTGLLQKHRTATMDDRNRQVQNSGFKSVGGIDSLPAASRAMMIAELAFSLAHTVQTDEDKSEAAASALTIAQEYCNQDLLTEAIAQATVARKLKSINELAAIDGIERKDGETDKAWIARVRSGIKA